MIKFLEVKRAYYADPENVRVEYWDGSKWWQHHCDDPDWTQADDWRIRPRTIRIGEINVQEPVREALNYGQNYFTVATTDLNLFCVCAWGHHRVDVSRLSRGLIHLTKEAAIEHAKALIIVSGGKV